MNEILLYKRVIALTESERLFTDGMPDTEEESRNHRKYHYLVQELRLDDYQLRAYY